MMSVCWGKVPARGLPIEDHEACVASMHVEQLTITLHQTFQAQLESARKNHQQSKCSESHEQQQVRQELPEATSYQY